MKLKTIGVAVPAEAETTHIQMSLLHRHKRGNVAVTGEPRLHQKHRRRTHSMNRLHQLLTLTICLGLEAGAHSCLAQGTFRERFSQHNSSMTALQPALITPLVAPDPRIVQYIKFSFANQYTPTGKQTVNFGNSRGFGLIAGNRVEFDFTPPPYIQHNSSVLDGFGDTATLAKYRIVSGNAKHGNFQLTAILSRSFATGSHRNGA